MIVIAICGKIGSGKDTASDYLYKNHDFISFSFSDTIKEKVLEEGLKINRKNLQDIGIKYREKHGKDYWARLLVQKAKKSKSDKIILKEARIKQDVLPAKKEFGENFKILEICASPETRFERLKARNGPKDPENYEEFVVQEKREEALNFYGAAKIADFKILNKKSIKKLHKNLESLLNVINS